MNKAEAKEILKALTVAGLPLVLTPAGAALLSLANECFNSSGKLRQDKWQEEIVKKITNQEKEFEEKIRNSQNFASLFANAQRGALEDVEEDKVKLYANAFINSIKNESVEDAKKHIFLNMLRDFTLLHIEVLKELKGRVLPDIAHANDFEKDSYQKGVLKILKKKFNNSVLLTIAIKNLYENNLIKAEKIVDMQFRGNVDNEKLYPQALSLLGNEFLEFISDCEEVND